MTAMTVIANEWMIGFYNGLLVLHKFYETKTAILYDHVEHSPRVRVHFSKRCIIKRPTRIF